MKRLLVGLLLLFSVSAQAQQRQLLVLADRLEYVSDPEVWLWDAQGWYGTDENKLWWKTEGEIDRDGTEEADLQLLYSRAISAYWDLQLGAIHHFEPDALSGAVIGLQGLAPQWFEVDVAAVIDENGDLSARFEAEYDLLITQRLILQPRVELNTLSESVALGLRFRYEIRREIAPYLGVTWQDEEGHEAFTSLVAGVRLWF